MHKLDLINQKIATLQKQRDTLERQGAWTLFQSMKEIMAQDFEPTLLLALVKDTWNARTPQKMEAWKKASASFQRPKASLCKDPKIHTASTPA